MRVWRYISSRLRRRAGRSGEAGFTLIEVVVAALLIGIGLLGVLASMDSFRTLASTASAKEEATQVVEQEVERLRGLGSDLLVMTGDPRTSGDPGTLGDPDDPRSGVSGTPPHYRPSDDAALEELDIGTTANQVTHQATPWSSDTAGGKLYRFVTIQDCDEAAGCPKRITVAATFSSPDDPKRPLVASSLVTDPDLVDGAGNPNYESGSPPTDATKTWYAYDTYANNLLRQLQTASHATHATAQAVTGQDRIPDLLGTTPAPNGSSGPYNYSNDVSGSYPLGGAAVRRSNAGCDGSVPSGSAAGELNRRAHWWVTPGGQSQTMTLTGNGALSFPTQTVGATAGSVKICVGVYRMELEATGKFKSSQLLGEVSYSLPDWPTAPETVSFPFRFLAAGTTQQIATNRRLGFRVTVDASSAADVAFLYDHPTFPANFQVETR